MASRMKREGPDADVNVPGILRGLLSALQVLEWPPQVQCTLLYPDGTGDADDMALDFDNWYSAALANLALTPGQRTRLKAVDELIEQMSLGNPRFTEDLWTDDALRSRAEWAEVRKTARLAIEALGRRPIPPPTQSLWQKRSEGVYQLWIWPEA